MNRRHFLQTAAVATGVSLVSGMPQYLGKRLHRLTEALDSH